MAWDAESSTGEEGRATSGHLPALRARTLRVGPPSEFVDGDYKEQGAHLHTPGPSTHQRGQGYEDAPGGFGDSCKRPNQPDKGETLAYGLRLSL